MDIHHRYLINSLFDFISIYPFYQQRLNSNDRRGAVHGLNPENNDYLITDHISLIK